MTNLPRVGKPERQTGNMFRDSSMGLVDQTVNELIALNHGVWRHNSARSALVEMIRLRNARTVNCVFCKSMRYDVAREDGLTEDKVSKIADGFDDSDLTEQEKLVLGFADTYLKNPANPDPELLDRLRAHFTGEQIAHMAISLATFNATSKCAVSLGGMPESLPVTEISFAASFGSEPPRSATERSTPATP